jgi:tetratricopeptide (TPR) repeat protein
MRRVAAFLILGVLAPLSVCADTIVLKNGRRIVASHVIEKDGKVTYETSAGQFSLPKSIVDHIERGALSGSDSAARDAAELSITPPPAETGAEAGSASLEAVLHGAVHDGEIDRAYIAKLEGEARGGGRQAAERAALAHHAAGQFELEHGNVDRALSEERTALTFAPEQPGILLNLAYMHLRRSEFKQALEFLERARRIAPRSADVAKLSGWAYFGMNKLKEAIAEWKRAQEIRPDGEVQAALAKAERDLQEEENYKENESSHFTLKYTGGAAPDLARGVLRTLEKDYDEIESELQFTPPDAIGVILYTQETFADITRAPGWVGAINDGRIRVPVQGLTSVTPELEHVLKHELTHSFLAQKTHGRCPVWLSEGIAQWMEGRRSGDNALALVQTYEAKQFMPFVELEGSWMRLSGDAASYAYAWSLAGVEYLLQSSGMTDLTRILDRITSGSSTEGALREVLRSNYPEFTAETSEYLRKHYIH